MDMDMEKQKEFAKKLIDLMAEYKISPTDLMAVVSSGMRGKSWAVKTEDGEPVGFVCGAPSFCDELEKIYMEHTSGDVVRQEEETE